MIDCTEQYDLTPARAEFHTEGLILLSGDEALLMDALHGMLGCCDICDEHINRLLLQLRKIAERFHDAAT